ncbi:MAG TPA: hypothetical protein VLJ21_03155 [Candidatus Binatia bacterium]|nr:hypothetical protein [Candidatus Binatia bacterium]
MEQFHLNDCLERAMQFYVRVKLEDKGWLSRNFGTYAAQDHREADKFLGMLNYVLWLPPESQRASYVAYKPKLEASVNYTRDASRLDEVSFDDVTKEQYLNALDYLVDAVFDYEPKPIRPAA